MRKKPRQDRQTIQDKPETVKVDREPSKLPVWIVITLFLFSGATALLYEIIWVRYLGIAFGSTTYSITTVLAAFMAGLSLGSVVIGKLVDKAGQRPLRLYALLELGIGLFAFASPWIFSAFIDLSSSLLPETALLDSEESVWIKFLAGFLLLLMPTCLMGGSLPALSRVIIDDTDKIKNLMGTLYSVNTLGAVLGAFITGFFLIFTMGMTFTLILAGAINCVVALLAFLLDRKHGFEINETSSVADHKENVGFVGEKLRFILFGAFLASGGLALMYEVLWTRLLIQSIGASSFGFTMILIAFLIGLAGGSYLFSHLLPAKWLNVLTFALLQVGIALGVFILIPLFALLPEFILEIFKAGYSDYWQVSGGTFLIVLLIVLPSTMCMGATFPVIAHMITQSRSSLGTDIGRAYFFNTFGAIVGTVLAGFVLIPQLGALPSMRLGITLNLALGVALIWVAVALKHQLPMKRAIAVTLVSVLSLLPIWKVDFSSDLSAICVGIYGNDLINSDKTQPLGGLVYEKDGINARITVRQAYDHRFLQVNGKTDASNGNDMATQLLLGLLPTLYQTKEGPSFVIGYGSGLTARVIAEERQSEEVDVAEIEKAVIEAGKYFEEINRKVEAMPNVRIVSNDARNFLNGTSTKYSIIVSEPSNPWIAGIGGLFTTDFYQMAAERLQEDGVFVQWIHLYSLSLENHRMILKTLLKTFPYAEIWEPIPGDSIIVASRKPLKFTDSLSMNLKKDPKRWKEYSEDLWIREPEELLARRYGSLENQTIIASKYENSDNMPRLEFTAPWSLNKDTVSENRAWLKSLFPDNDSLKQAPVLAAKARYFAGGGLLDEGLELASQAFLSNPSSANVALTFADLNLRAGDPNKSIEAIMSNSSLQNSSEAMLILASARNLLGEKYGAESAFARINEPENLSRSQFQEWCEMALAFHAFERLNEAMAKRESLHGQDYKSKHYPGVAAYKLKEYGKAENLLRESLKLNPFNGVAIFYLGHALWEQGKIDEALELYREYNARWGHNDLIEKRIKERS